MKGAKGVEKFRERGESHGILRKAGMMITEVMKISEPPYTNRGVTRQKEDLTALIDWCQITVKGVDVFIIIEDILRIPLSFMELHGKEKGIAGHELIARFDNIKILKPTGNAQYEGFQILMSGSGCRNYENFLRMNKETWFDFLERVCRYPVNFPRIDLAIDDTKPYLSIPELIRLKNEGLISSQLRDTAENRSDRLKEDEIEAQGKTLYLGSKHSDFRITFYEKGYEQAEKFGKELNPDWNRYELRFRHKKAVRLVEELLKDRDVARIALSVLNEKVRFLQKTENSTGTRKRLYPTYPPWEELMQDVGKIKLTMNPEKKTLERTWQWLNVAVSPSLKLMDKIGKLDNRGKKVPAVKSKESWNLTLDGLLELAKNRSIPEGKETEEGNSYEQYLQMMLVLKSKEELSMRALDLVEMNLRSGMEKTFFRADACVSGADFDMTCYLRRGIRYQYHILYQYQ